MSALLYDMCNSSVKERLARSVSQSVGKESVHVIGPRAVKVAFNKFQSIFCSPYISSALPFIVDDVHIERYSGVDVEVGRCFCAS